MRIDHILFKAFGPFTDLTIDFSGGSGGLHLVYGPNEAGKSSALRGLRYWLYGFPVQLSDDFRHPYSKMRIGGKLIAPNGHSLSFVRRKGRKRTLRGADDNAIVEESELQALLGGVDEAVFETLFGIDHSELVRGGAEMIRGGGDIGRLLFAAGTGISDLHKIQTALTDEADRLFRPAGKKPMINAAIVALRHSRAGLRKAQLSGDQWITHDRALKQAIDRRQRVDRRLAECEEQRQRLSRLKEALPFIARREEIRAKLTRLAGAPVLDDDFSTRRRALLRSLELATHEARQLKSALKDEQAVHRQQTDRSNLIDHANEIEALQQQLGSHLKAAADRSRLTANAQLLSREADTIWQSLHPDWDPAKDSFSRELQPNKRQIIRIQALGRQHQALLVQMTAAQTELRQIEARHERLQKEMAALESAPDPKELSALLARPQPLGDLETTLNVEQHRLSDVKETILAGLAKQNLWQGPPTALVRLALPVLETIDRFDRGYDDRNAAVAEDRKNLKRLEQQLSTAAQKIDQMQLEQTVPTEDDLVRARRLRQRGWRLVVQDWQSEGDTDAQQRYVDRVGSGDNLADAYAHAVQAADHLSDRLRREADRVAGLATLQTEWQHCRQAAADCKKRLAEHEAELESYRQEWLALWRTLSIEPLSPREMRAWTADMRYLAEQQLALETQQADYARRSKQLAESRRELKQMLAALAAPAVDDSRPWAGLLSHSNAFVEWCNSQRLKRQQLEHQIAVQATNLAEQQVRITQIDSELNRWHTDWHTAVSPLGLAASATPDEVTALVEDIKTGLDKRREADALRNRIDAIDRDARAFETNLSALKEHLASELDDTSPQGVVRALADRLLQARKAKARQDELTHQRTRQQKRLKQLHAQIDGIQADVAVMVNEAGCTSADELTTAEKRSQQVKQLSQQLQEAETHLSRLSGGRSLTALRDEVRRTATDEIEPTLLRLSQEIADLMSERSQLDENIGSEGAILKQMDGNAEAAQLAEAVESNIGALSDHVQRDTRLRIAVEILELAIERYRQENQDPILARSAELFRHMTCRAFNGLQTGYDVKGRPVIEALRANGSERVTVDGMSDGTADQLFLAVRLASIEQYLQKHQGLPLILDDILIHFDDHRAQATLQVLADLGRQNQIIFFTHHRHLLDLARSGLKTDQFFVHHLPVIF